MNLAIDFETRAVVDIKKTGPWVYAEHPNTEPLCLAMRTDKGAKGLWVNPKIYRPEFRNELACSSDPGQFIEAINRAEIIEAHNAEFERAIWRMIMVPRLGWPDIPDHKWRCSLAKAAAFALPRSLEGSGAALKVPVQKDKAGHTLMLKLCKPRKPRKGEPDGLYWYEDPKDLITLFRYCLQDVEAEHAVSSALPDLNPIEQKVWHLDQKMNERGIQADTRLAKQMISIICKHEETLLGEVELLTEGRIQSVKQVAAMSEYCGTDDMTKATVAAALEGDLAPEVRRLLEIRQSLGLASVSKYKAVLDRANLDGRIRGTVLYHAATTGRWAGRGVQLQNLPRKGIEQEYLELALALVRSGDMDWIENCFGDVMQLAQALIRPTLTAAPGQDLICADFASIEARVLLWLAGETEGVELFRSGADIYLDMATTIYERAVTKADKKERQVGKTAILGLGFGMGAPKFKATCAIQAKVEIDKKLARKVVKTYRAKYPNVKEFWYATERAAIAALQTGNPVEYGKTTWFTRDKFLHCRLPSGRLLSYPYPTLVIEPAYIYPCIDEDGKETSIMIVGRNQPERRAKKRAEDEDLRIVGPPIEREKSVLTHMAVVKGKWLREATYGGKLVENIVQATARDLMAEAMLRLEDSGYPVILSVHDEVISEVPEGFGSLEEYEQIMAQVPEWAEGCPVAAEGWRGKRYRK